MKNPFEYQAPTAAQIEVISLFREMLNDIHEELLGQLPGSRERALAATKLEEASMWINKAIVFNGVVGDE